MCLSGHHFVVNIRVFLLYLPHIYTHVHIYKYTTWTSYHTHVDRLPQPFGPAATPTWTSCHTHLDQLQHPHGPAATPTLTSCHTHIDQMPHPPEPAATPTWTCHHTHLDQLPYQPSTAQLFYDISESGQLPFATENNMSLYLLCAS